MSVSGVYTFEDDGVINDFYTSILENPISAVLTISILLSVAIGKSIVLEFE